MTQDDQSPTPILSTEEAVRAHLEESVAAASAILGAAVQPIYRADRNGRPTLFGTGFCLALGGRKYLVTAAHVVDDILKDGGYVLGDGEFVPLLGDFYCTEAPKGDRDCDYLDFAWKCLSDDDVATLGWSVFFYEKDLCENRAPTVGRVYLALGYPRSKNKKADPTSRKVRPKMNKYYSTGKAFPDLFASLELSGHEHIAIAHANRSVDPDGVGVNSVYPRGMSGGPFIDLGRNSSLADLARKEPFQGRLAGMLIEKYDEHDALVAVKIDLIVTAIQATPPTAATVYLSHPAVPAGQQPSVDR
jgi:hypothetical protein